MSFQVHALNESDFSEYPKLSENELNSRNAMKVVVDECPGFTCRVTLKDVEVGETVLLVNYQHMQHESPYQSTHAIYVKPEAKQIILAENELPDSILSRLISLRGFDRKGMLKNAEVAEGIKVAAMIDKLFTDTEIEFIHLHNAKYGCYAARVTRGT